MRLIITGSTGYLGQRLALQAARDHDVVAGFSRHPDAVTAGEPVHLDFLKPQALAESLKNLKLRAGHDAVIHTAALNPGGDENWMHTVNVEGSRLVAQAAADAHVRLIHISTDVVHDGRHAPYPDNAEPKPLGTYGRTKADAEKAVLKAHPDAVIVRTSLIYGLHALDNGTASFVKRIESGEPLKLFHDVHRQPIWVESLAKALVELAHNRHTGHLNIAGRQSLTREAFGRKMLRYWQIPEPYRIESVSAAKISDKIPLDLRLNISRAESMGLRLPGVDKVLAAAAVF